MFLPVLLLAITKAANKQRIALISMLVEAMTTGMMMLMVLIEEACSGVVLASSVQSRAVNTNTVQQSPISHFSVMLAI